MADIDAWGGITRGYPTRDQANEYIKLFQLEESFANINEPGELDELIAFFAIRSTVTNRRQLDIALGKNWQRHFVKKLRLPDNEDDRVRAYVDPSSGETFESITDLANQRAGNNGFDNMFGFNTLVGGGWDETMYCFFPTPEFFSKMNNEISGIILTMGFDMSLGYEDAEWWEKLLAIVVIIFLAWVTGGTAIAYFAAAVQVLAIAFELELPIAMQIGLAVLSLGSNWATMPIGQAVLQIANLALEVAEVYQAETFADEMKAEREEQKRIKEEWEAESMEQRYKFSFGSGFFHSYLNEGVHKDPNTFYYETYNEFSIYKNTSYNLWSQID